MTYVKVNGVRYPATVRGNTNDRLWENRDSKAITMESDYAAAVNTFVDHVVWSIEIDTEILEPVLDDEDNQVVIDGEPQYHQIISTQSYDNSEYCIAGPITDYRNGTVCVKMGKMTEAEQYAENSIPKEDIEDAYIEGVDNA